jgi:hypothetical protein
MWRVVAILDLVRRRPVLELSVVLNTQPLASMISVNGQRSKP